jgi:hypothetical protein
MDAMDANFVSDYLPCIRQIEAAAARHCRLPMGIGSEEEGEEEQLVGEGKKKGAAAALMEEGAAAAAAAASRASDPQGSKKKEGEDDAYDVAYWRERVGAALGALHARAAALAAGKVINRGDCDLACHVFSGRSSWIDSPTLLVKIQTQGTYQQGAQQLLTACRRKRHADESSSSSSSSIDSFLLAPLATLLDAHPLLAPSSSSSSLRAVMDGSEALYARAFCQVGLGFRSCDPQSSTISYDAKHT